MIMSNEQAVQILKPLRDMMVDQNGHPISDAVFALDKAIEALSVQLEKGHWIVKQDYNGSTYGECSVCHSVQYAGHTPYCPTCGSRMIGGTQ